ncbi:MAG: hemerythrin domain-containing protein [Patescibacteria group bacterium]|nr:hemerythrin domain-containing protein [Patescibacteria group bacterium]MDE2144363.1 hemerythrin domain-containing protein [Patescibacteria group bacterium]
MKKYIWKKEYGIGVKLIDEQHRQFFKIANDLLDLLGKKTINRKRISAIAFTLGDYTFYHLKTEEDYLIKFGLDNKAKSHILSHKAFRKKVEGFLAKIENKNSNIELVAKDMVDFTVDWIQNHLLTADKKYTKLLLDKGVKASELATNPSLSAIRGKPRRVRKEAATSA